MSKPATSIDLTDALAYVNVILSDGKPREFRFIKPGRKGSESWTWTPEKTHADIRDAISRAQSDGFNVYVTVNPVRPDAIKRDKAQKDEDIERRVFLPVDIDPNRPSGTLATPEQSEAARALAEKLVEEWYRPNFPDHMEPLFGHSGSGYQILIPCDIPADNGGDEIVKGLLKLLAKAYDTEAAHVDTSVSNRSRIMRVCGTKAFYSDGNRPGRMISGPSESMPVLTVDDLRSIIAPPERQAKHEPPVATLNGFHRGDVAKRLDRYIEPILDDIRTALDGTKHPVLFRKAAKIAEHAAAERQLHRKSELKERIRQALKDNPGHFDSWDDANRTIDDAWDKGSQNPTPKTLPDREPPTAKREGPAPTVVPEEFGGPRAERTLAEMGFTSGSDISTEPIEYLIPGVMARGELTLIVGAAGSGKTKIAISRAAHLTTGQSIDGKPVRGGAQKVAIISFEECPRRTIKPVCDFSGMDSSRAMIYEQPIGSPGISSVADLCDMLGKLADDGVAYVVIDSLTALFSRLGYDVNDTKAPYAIHGAINLVAREKNICVELIHHYGKASGAAYDNHQKAAGSYAIFASVRSVLQVEHDTTTGTRFIGVSPNKNNLGLLTDCLAFRTTRVAEHVNDGQGYIIAEIGGWNTSETIDDVSARITKAKNDDMRSRVRPVAVEVAEVIGEYLDKAEGVAAVKDVEKHLTNAGYSPNAIVSGKKSFESFQVRRVKKWFLTNISESKARAIIDDRFPEAS